MRLAVACTERVACDLPHPAYRGGIAIPCSHLARTSIAYPIPPPLPTNHPFRWHLGYSYGETTLLPLNQGFTSFVGTPVTHCEGPPSYPAIPLFHNNTIVGRLGIDVDINTQLIYNYTDAATQFIRDHGPGGSREDVPFFIYYALDNTHEKVFYPANYSGISLRGDFGDAMHAYDWSLGQILDTLADTGLDAHVPTVYTTDNGGWRAISVDQAGEVGQFSAAWFSSTYGTDDLGKGSTWEGGFRVPGLVRWPGVVPAGTQNLAYANSLDVYPTFVSLAGASMPSGVVHDGEDITALFLGAGAEGGELTEARQAGLTWQEAARRRIARSHGIGSGLAAEDLWADMEGARDGIPVVTGRALKTEADAAVSRKPFMYYRGQHLLAARGVGNMSAYKAHFGTHTGFGHEPIVWHDPPVIFDVEVDPAERSPVPNRPDIIKALTQAAAEHNATLVRGTPLLNEVDYKAMNCKGLTPEQSGCCLKDGGKCST